MEGERLSMSRSAGNIALLSENTEGLEELLNTTEQVLESYNSKQVQDVKEFLLGKKITKVRSRYQGNKT